MFIKSIKFRNVRVLRETELPLGRFTLLIGPNGSGKTTALHALASFAPPKWPWPEGFSVGLEGDRSTWEARMELQWIDDGSSESISDVTTIFRYRPPEGQTLEYQRPSGVDGGAKSKLRLWAKRIRLYSFNASRIAEAVPLQPSAEMDPSGHFMSVVLDRLRDLYPERFERINEALTSWLPEFDRILFDTPSEGQRCVALRTRKGKHNIGAADLSQGTLIVLALFALAYSAQPPSLVLVEEPDRGLHPRLLRGVKDALYRLSFPEESGEDREPVQVVATTHSPYFLDLFRDHPEQIVVAEKKGNEAMFSRLVDRDDLDGLLDESPLGDLWYSGVLGGVPSDA
ncbi:MAG: AAA family ATPase [Phycisphaerales bacterium]